MGILVITELDLTLRVHVPLSKMMHDPTDVVFIALFYRKIGLCKNNKDIPYLDSELGRH